MKIFIVTVVAQLLNSCGDVVHTVSEQYIPVEASSHAKASEAAVIWLREGQTQPVYNADEVFSQQSISSTHIAHPECCHAVLWQGLNLRYVSIRAMPISRAELDCFYTMTCGLISGHLVQGE